MEKTQWYIGADNGVVVCVDGVTQKEIFGRFYHSYDEKAVGFATWEELLFKMERFFDFLKFPYPSTNERFFQETRHETYSNEKRVKIVKDEQLLKMHGDLGNFIIRVQQRQNSSWQGRITWMEQNKTVNFRSVWEMMKLMENALDTVSKSDEDEPEQNWGTDGK